MYLLCSAHEVILQMCKKYLLVYNLSVKSTGGSVLGKTSVASRGSVPLSRAGCVLLAALDGTLCRRSASSEVCILTRIPCKHN